MSDDPLFAPLRVGACGLRNRVVMLPMGTRWGRAGKVSEMDLAWHRERSTSVGAVIAGGTVVHPTSTLRGVDTGLIEAFNRHGQEMQRRRAEVIHQNGASFFGQILHLGRETIGAQSDHPTLAPSAIRSERTPDAPHEMTQTEIETIVESFALSARLQEEAGLDGVEIHAAHGYLVAQFLSPASNHREDRYAGAELGTRMRFLTEIVSEIRRVCRSEFVLGVRLSVDEEYPGGMATEDTIEIVQALNGAAEIDYLSLTVGMRGAYVKDHATPLGTAVERAARVHQETSLPLLVASRITTPALARAILESQQADLVGLGRALIADPQWVEKARDGYERRIRPCVGFVQDCRVAPGGALCGVNAVAGRELSWSSLPRTRQPQTVAIAGGGPGGMEAARLAAELGHVVTLYETSAELGGQWNQAALGPGRGELAGFVHYLTRELARLGVDVRLGHAVTADELQSAAPDRIVLATGARPAPASFPFDRVIPVLSAPDALAADETLFAGKRSIVIDDGSGFWPSASAAERLAAVSTETVIVTPAAMFGGNIPHESIVGLHQRLRAAGARYRPFGTVTGIHGHVVQVRDSVPGMSETLYADVVVYYAGRIAETELARDLDAAGVPFAAVGDCVAPRRVGDATFDANRVMRDWSAARIVADIGSSTTGLGTAGSVLERNGT